MGTSFRKASDTAECISIEFVKGVPTKLNGEALDGVTLINKLNDIKGIYTYVYNEVDLKRDGEWKI